MADEGQPLRRLRAYYRLLVPFGLGSTRRRLGIMHRSIRPAASTPREEALLFVDRRVARMLARHLVPSPGPPRLIDLGCGIGGTIRLLARELRAVAVGVTVGLDQARRFARLQRAGCGRGDARCAVVVGDFHRLPFRSESFDAACAIESLAHSPCPETVFDEIARSLRPDGVLVICDDLANPAATGPWARRTLGRFVRGWRLGALLCRRCLVRIAARAGFVLVEEHDLTPLVRQHPSLGEPLVRPFAVLPLPGVLGGALTGAGARERAVHADWLDYRLPAFRRASPS